MKAQLLSAAALALKLYIGGGMFNRIGELVVRLIGDSSMTGQEKMGLVVTQMKAEAVGLSETVIRTIAQIILLKLKS